MFAATRGIAISDADAAKLTDRFAWMPPHPEVPAALPRLRDPGFRLFTLTNNALDVSGRQLEKAGVIDLVERRRDRAPPQAGARGIPLGGCSAPGRSGRHRGDLDAIADQLMERYPAPATVAGSKTR